LQGGGVLVDGVLAGFGEGDDDQLAVSAGAGLAQAAGRLLTGVVCPELSGRIF